MNIYTDGACSGNPGKGGWGVVLFNNDDSLHDQMSGYVEYTTNNQMELTAAISALHYIQKHEISQACIYTDSMYVYKGITEWINGWKKRKWNKVKNVDLWQELDELVCITCCNLGWKWVKAHSGVLGNEMADEIAVNAYLKRDQNAY